MSVLDQAAISGVSGDAARALRTDTDVDALLDALAVDAPERRVLLLAGASSRLQTPSR